MLRPTLRRLNVVLIAPDIPGNTGCIGRTCMAVGARLHLVHPLGFSTDERSLRRAGLDYWPKLIEDKLVVEHASWDDFIACEFGGADTAAIGRPWLYTTHAERPHWDATYAPGDYLLFGSETRGAAKEVHEYVGADGRVTLPMVAEARSTNLAAAVSAGLYEAVRQCSVREAG